MPDLGDDRIGLVGVALLEAAGMNMDVGHDGSSRCAAMAPEIAEPPPIDFDDPAAQGVRINIVVKDEFFDPSRGALRAEKERATLAMPAPAPPELRELRRARPPRGTGSQAAARRRCARALL